MNGQDAYIAVVGAVNVDISGTPEDAYVPGDSNPWGATLPKTGARLGTG